MQRKNIIKLAFYIGLITSSLILGFFLSKINNLVSTAQNLADIVSLYNGLQKQIGITNIIIFIFLLLISLVEFYQNANNKLIFLANIFFVASSLFLYVSVNRDFYQLQSSNYTDQGGYWLTLFMGVFYIIGGVLISTIGYITVRNNAKRKINAKK